MILTPSQGIVADDRHRFRVVCCGRRWGKTTLAVEEMKGRALFTKANIAYIAPTYQQARDIAWETLKKEMRGAFLTDPNESRLEMKIRNTKGEESMISLRGWESIDSLRGLSFDMLIIDEVAMMRNFWTNWEEVVRPTLTDRKGEVMFISTPKGFNHFYELFNMELDKEKGNEYKSFHFTTYDNPHLDAIEVDKARQEITETRFAQEYLADFKKVEGLVYKEFERTRHLYDRLAEDKHYDFIGGVDFGFNNPAAVVHVKRDTNGVYFVDNEWYQTKRTENQIADYVLSCKFNKVYPDPENPSAIFLLSQKGVNIREVIKNKDSVKNGINKVRDLFKQNKLMINKRCMNLITELEAYCYPDSKEGGNEDENPIKENDHLLDALRYIVYMEHLVKRKIQAEKPRAIISDSKYEGKIPVGVVDPDEITDDELARM